MGLSRWDLPPRQRPALNPSLQAEASTERSCTGGQEWMSLLKCKAGESQRDKGWMEPHAFSLSPGLLAARTPAGTWHPELGPMSCLSSPGLQGSFEGSGALPEQNKRAFCLGLLLLFSFVGGRICQRLSSRVGTGCPSVCVVEFMFCFSVPGSALRA